MQALRTHSFYTQALVNCLQRLLRNIRPALIVRLRGKRDRRWQHRPPRGRESRIRRSAQDIPKRPGFPGQAGPLDPCSKGPGIRPKTQRLASQIGAFHSCPLHLAKTDGKKKGASDCSKKPCRSPLIASAKVKPACKMVARSARVRKAQQRAVTRKLSAAPEPSTQVKPTAGNDWRESAQPCRSPWISSAKVKPACKSAERSPAGRKLQKRAVKWNLFAAPEPSTHVKLKSLTCEEADVLARTEASDSSESTQRRLPELACQQHGPLENLYTKDVRWSGGPRCPVYLTPTRSTRTNQALPPLPGAPTHVETALTPNLEAQKTTVFSA